MFINEYTLILDLKKKMTAKVPQFVQYDNATLVFKIFDDGKMYDLSSFTKAEVAHKRPDGQIVVGTANLETLINGERVVRYNYLGSEMHNTGFVETSLSIFSQDKKVTTQPFKVEIITDNRDGLVQDSKEEMGILQELIAEISLVLIDAKNAINDANDAVTIATQATTDATTAIDNANIAVTDAQNAVTETNQVKNDTLIAKAEAEQAAINANSAVINLVHKGEYNPTTSYVERNIVSLDGSSYINIIPSTGVSPTNTNNWRIVGKKGDTGDRGIPGIQGIPGVKGDTGKGFSIAKTYNSVAQMYADYSNPLISVGDFVLINTTDINNPENAMLFVKTSTDYSYLTDLSGAQGIKGEKGIDGTSFTWRDAYNDTLTYLKNDVTYYDGSSFIALKANLGITPANDGVNWSTVAQRGVDGTGAVSTVDGFNPDANGDVITHTNKTVLDALTDDAGQLKYNGTTVGSVTSVNNQVGDVTGLETVVDSNTKLATKVDKVTGKGLSTEDYTTIEKTKLTGIETGAQVNTITSVNGQSGAITGLATDTSVDGKIDTINNAKIDKTVINQPNGVAGLDEYGHLGTDLIIDKVSQQLLSQTVSDVVSHQSNKEIHVTQTKKNEWDAKATPTYVDNKIGNLPDLQTTEKSNLVVAVNELTTRFTETVTGIYNARLNGLVGDGVTNDYPSLNSILTTIGGASATIFFEPGIYKLSSNITIPSNVTLWFLNGAMISPDSGVTVTINGSIEAGLYTIFTGLGAIAGKIKVPMAFPEWFGAKGDGATNDSSAIQKAINTGAHVRLSQGTYYIGNTGLTNVKGLSGVGKSLTKLTYDGSTTTAISVTNESWEIRGLSIEHVGSHSGSYAMVISNGSYGTLESVFVRNGTNGVSIADSQSIKIYDVEIWSFLGYGLLFNGGNNDIFVSKLFINGQATSNTAGNGTGIRILNKAEAITFDSVEVILCNYALNTDAVDNSNGNRPGYCRFTNCFFDSSTNGVLIDKVVNFHFNQCWFSNRPNNGCVLNSGDDIVFSECSFVNNAQHGCLVQSASKRVKFLGCSFISNSATTSNTSYGLIFGSGSTDFIVKDCTATNGLGFPSTQRTGIIVADGASDRYIVADNLINGNITSGVVDGGTGTNKRVTNNY